MEIKFAKGFSKSFNECFSNNLIYLIPRKLNDWKFEIKWAWQRVFRGYDDTAVWNLNHWHTDIMIKVLTELRDNHNGCPFEFFDGKAENQSWKWDAELDKMIDCFKSAEKMDSWGDRKEYKKLEKEFEKGMKLFAKNYFGLWD